MRGKPLVLIELDNGCIVPTSHKLNKDGYLRIRDPNYKGEGRAPLVMYHRYLWEQSNGKVPDGYELHHTCHNRSCQNINHLKLISITKHKVKHNSTRYLDRKTKAREIWIRCKCSGTKLAKLMGVSYSTGCKWIREWKCRD